MNRRSNIDEVQRVVAQKVLEGHVKEGLLEALKVAVPFVVDSTKLPQESPKYWDTQMAAMPFPVIYCDFLFEEGSLGVLLVKSEEYLVSCFSFGVLKEEILVYPEKFHLLESGNLQIAEGDKEFCQGVGFALINFLFLLNSENTYEEKVAASDKLQRKRAKKGKAPIPEFRVIKVKKSMTRYLGSKSEGEKKHRSPRPHIRRGHFRHYETKTIWVHPMVVGDPHKVEYVI